MRDDKPVRGRRSRPGRRRVHYYEVDETNVGKTDRPKQPAADEAQKSDER